MRLSIISPLLLSSLIAIGCGGKDKKKTSTSTAVATDVPGAVADSEEASQDSSDSGPSAAELQGVLYFEFDSSELDDEARERLQKNADWMKEDESRVLTIEGHTDEAGTSDYNLALGENRARKTRDYLVRLGVDASRVQIITYGEEKPAGSDDSLNRRSVFVATRK